MATKESMMNFISGSPKQSDYVPYVADAEEHVDTAPQLEVLSCPSAVNKRLVVISGSLKDSAEREPHLYINQKEVSVRGDKWLASVPINEGINHIIIMAMNNTGKHVFTSRDVFCGFLPPILEVDKLPELTSQASVTISGKVSDVNGGVTETPEVSINGNAIEVGADGKWSCPVTLRDGENAFLIAAKNSAKAPSVVKKVFLRGANMPELMLTEFPESSASTLPVISGTLTPAPNGKPCRLRINDQDVPVNSSGAFTTKVKLRQSDAPPVVFTVIADSTHTFQRQMKFDPPPPKNVITKCEPAQKHILYRLAGVASDENCAISSVSVNGKEMALNKGAWNTVMTIKFGFTPLVIATKSAFGKVSVLLGNIYLEQKPPELIITECPNSIKAASVTISGTIKDPDAEMPPVIFVNSAVADIKGDQWEATVPLLPGTVNPVKITAKSDTGKVVEIVKEIDCTIIMPTLKVLNCPRETNEPNLILRGFARSGFLDNQNDVKVFVNNTEIEFADGKWVHSVTLNKGANSFVIAAENKDGERVEDKKSVVLV